MAMDILKNGVANIADLIDRQMAQLCNPHTNNGLPADLVARSEDDRVSHHGFKAMQITTSALTAEALKLTMPASVFSRSTESHNQDKVSLGTIAARDCLRVLELTEQVAAATLLGALQGLELRVRNGEFKAWALPDEVGQLLNAVRAQAAFVEEDRPLENDLRWL